MIAWEAIVTRRSIRSFLDQKVSRHDIEKFLFAAIHAPSSSNLQPWQFLVLDDPALISKACHMNQDAYWGSRAPAAILVLGDPGPHFEKGFWVQDCAALTSNLLLLIHAAGLGATWTGVYPKQDRVNGLRALLNIPETLIPFSLVLLGYPKHQGAEKTHVLEGRIRYNRFTERLSTRYSYSSRPPKTPSQGSSES